MGSKDIRGTMGYICPEILRGEPYGVEADIWSAGIILFELLVGYKPFVNYRDCLDKNIVYNESDWSNKSDLARNLINQMLERDPDKRISAEQALKHSWIAKNLL